MGSMGSSQAGSKDGKDHSISQIPQHTAFHILTPLSLGYVHNQRQLTTMASAPPPCLFITDVFFLGGTENNGASPLIPPRVP